MDEFSKDLILISSALSSFGVAFLVKLIWKHHKTRISALKLITFKNLDDEIKAFECIIERLNLRFKERISDLENKKESIFDPFWINERLILINETSDLLNSHVYLYEGGSTPRYIRKVNANLKKLFFSNPESLKTIFEEYTDKINNDSNIK